MKTICLLFCFFISNAVLAGTREDSVSDSRCIEYGNEHECVVQIKGKRTVEEGKKQNSEFSASAVLINPNWALTAAHVVKGSDEVFIIVNGQKHKTDRVIVKKEFSEEKLGSNDMALCHCEEEFGLKFYPRLYSDREEVGKVASVCGYGASGKFSTGVVNWDGKKRAGSNIVARTEWDCLICTTTDRKTELEFLIAGGDSGGGLFVDGKLAGINSFVIATDRKPDSDFGDESGHVRISKYLEWIEEQTDIDFK